MDNKDNNINPDRDPEENIIPEEQTTENPDTEGTESVRAAVCGPADNTDELSENGCTGKTQPEKKNSTAAGLYDWLEIFAVSISIVFLLFAFVARIAVVDGSSMNNTLQDGDKLLVKEFLYKPKPGDIVVCQSEFFGFKEPLIKRIIAVGGQTIKIDFENWQVYVDGKPLEEDYVNRIANQYMAGWTYGGEYTVPEGHVFVMGDNRNYSWDSRDGKIGPICESYIIGKVVFRFLPFSSFGHVK